MILGHDETYSAIRDARVIRDADEGGKRGGKRGGMYVTVWGAWADFTATCIFSSNDDEGGELFIKPTAGHVRFSRISAN
jgi:hypothetical protein